VGRENVQGHPLEDPFLEDADECLNFDEPMTHPVGSVRHDQRVHEAVQAVEAGRGVSDDATWRSRHMSITIEKTPRRPAATGQ
jgi:hypothetical protein